MDWQTTTNRFVGFFDIMGFKDLVLKTDHEQLLEIMTNLKELILGPIENEAKENLKEIDKPVIENVNLKEAVVRPILFSDSIVLVSNTDHRGDLQKISLCSRWLVHQCIQYGIPVKGAISYGKFTCDFDNSIYFGQPLIDAYLLQD